MRQFQKPDQIVLALDVVEQGADALEIALRLDRLEQMRGAAHDQHLLVAVARAPGEERRQTLGHDLGGQRVEFGALALQLLPGFRRAPHPACGRAAGH